MKRPSGYFQGRAVRRRHYANRERLANVEQREAEQRERERRVIAELAQSGDAKIMLLQNPSSTYSGSELKDGV